nr:tail fiber protein [Chryseobacterium sp. SNU WT5]
MSFLAIFGLALFTNDIKAQSDPILGQIAFVAFNFAPRGWEECKGQTMSIAQNTALFALLGTTYGGDGMTTFKLPDMQGRSFIGDGQGVGLTPYIQGQMGGQESVTLLSSQMPMHSHGITAVKADGNQSTPNGNLPANTKVLDKEYSDATADTTMKSTMVSPTGGNQPHENRSPYLTMKCIIATQGIFPSRP